jgi:hypothetical protein
MARLEGWIAGFVEGVYSNGRLAGPSEPVPPHCFGACESLLIPVVLLAETSAINMLTSAFRQYPRYPMNERTDARR